MRFDAHQDYSTDVGIRDFGRHAGRGAFEQQAALALSAIVRRPRGALVSADLHQGTIASCEQKQVGLTRTNHSLVRSGFTNSRKSGSPQRDNTA